MSAEAWRGQWNALQKGKAFPVQYLLDRGGFIHAVASIWSSKRHEIGYSIVGFGALYLSGGDRTEVRAVPEELMARDPTEPFWAEGDVVVGDRVEVQRKEPHGLEGFVIKWYWAKVVAVVGR
mmetsp:Transcript_22128/g.54737  ORF Transcript_22128/g.54737 Transcript_22128/m.54737 type:complete len:122 (-) Transcript_22128:373-738(-)